LLAGGSTGRRAGMYSIAYLDTLGGDLVGRNRVSTSRISFTSASGKALPQDRNGRLLSVSIGFASRLARISLASEYYNVIGRHVGRYRKAHLLSRSEVQISSIGGWKKCCVAPMSAELLFPQRRWIFHRDVGGHQWVYSLETEYERSVPMRSLS